MKKLENKIALVTGGTTGIGLATARAFAAEGAKVIVTGSRPESVAVARDELRGVADVVQSDAGRSADIERLARDIKDKHGGLDVLFLNAGIAKFEPISVMEEASVDELFRVNFKGPWLALKHFASILRPGASVVINSSVVNRLGMPGTSAYAATKAAVRSLARSAASELADSQIRVNVVSPGPIETPIFGKLGMPQEALDDFAKTTIAKIPLKRFGAPDEIAKAVLFLASSDSSFVTGEEIVIAGGLGAV